MEIPMQSLLDLLLPQGVFAILFVWLLFNSQKEGKERELRLMTHLEKTTETLESLTNSIKDMNVKVDHIDSRLNQFEREKESVN